MNRRTPDGKGGWNNFPNPEGPVDQTVPVLRVMCFACFTMPLWNFTGQALSALGQPQYFARLALAQLVLAAASFAIAANFGLKVPNGTSFLEALRP